MSSSRADTRVETFDAFGVPVFAEGADEFMTAIDSWMKGRREGLPGEYICFRDVNGVVQSWYDPRLARAHEHAFINAPDGRPLVWLGRRRGYKNIERICGPDTTIAICKYGVARGWRHFFLGATDETLDRLVGNLTRMVPGLELAGTHSPPFRQLSEDETEAMLDTIRDSRCDILWVGLGCPKQEIWMEQHSKKLSGILSLGVGAAFDMHAGDVRRAPMWMAATGLEWLWRIAQEPARLGPRYAFAIPRFLARVVREEFSSASRLSVAVNVTAAKSNMPRRE